MDIIRKTAAAAVCISLLLSFFFAAPAAAVSDGYITGEFRYLTALSENSTEGTYYYSDGFFAESGKKSNAHLRTLSLELALTTFGSDGGLKHSEFTERLLSDIGFDEDDMYIADMNEPTSPDTLGSVMTHKKTVYGEVLAVAVRGGGYGLEWASNLMLGDSGDAEGFSKAANMLIDRIRAYEIRHGIISAKIWITGYSRAGGVAELAGKYINEHLREFRMSADDLYVYTFEAPAGSATYEYYENIHNIINPNDIVPLLYPETWGLYHVGVTETLAAEEIPIQRMQLGVTLSEGFSLQEQKNYEFDTKTFRIKETGTVEPVNVSAFIKEFVNWLSVNITRPVYAGTDEHFAEMISLIIGNDISGRSEFVSYLGEALLSGLNEDMLPLLYSAPGSEEYEGAVNSFIEKITDKISEDGKLTPEEAARLRSAVPNVLRTLMPVITRDLMGDRIFGNFGTFFGNGERILMQHADDAVLRLVLAEDPFYNGTEAAVIATEPPVTAPPEATAAVTTTAEVTSTTTTTTTTVTTTTTTTTATETTTAPETAAESEAETTAAPAETTTVTAAETVPETVVSGEEEEPEGPDENTLLIWTAAAASAGVAVIIGLSVMVLIHGKRK